MKNNSIFVLAILFAAGLNAQEIKFEHSAWADIKAKAKAENKLIFVDAFTTWCGPCKAMAKKTFTNDTVANYYNSNFINAKIDMEKGEGIDLAKEYQVSCYPNLLYIDGDGKLVHRAAGYLVPSEFMALAKTAQTPEKTFASLQRQYEGGNTSASFVSDYFRTLSQSCLSANDAAVQYLAKVKEADLVLPENWRILNDYVEGINSAPFSYFVKNRSTFAAKYTADSVNNKIFGSYLNAGYNVIYDKDAKPEAVSNLKKEIEKIGFERTEELNLFIDLPYYQSKNDLNGYYKVCKVIIEKYKAKDAGFLNNVSWTFYEKSKDKAQLADAEKWAKTASELGGPAEMDTYACLLFKNGKKKEAIAAEKKAIELAKADKQDTKDFEETLKKFEGGK